jgi:hypothetical protein
MRRARGVRAPLAALCPILAALGLPACAREPAPSLDAIAEGYVRVALQLAQHNPDLVDDWRGPIEWRPGLRVPVASLMARVDALQRDLNRVDARNSSPEALRRAYLRRQVAGLRFAAWRLLGEGPKPLREEAAAFLSLAATPGHHESVDRARSALARELAGSGTLAERYAAFKRRFIVPRGRRDAVMREALAACREATRAVVALPADEHVEFRFVSGLPWDGRTRYLGGHRTRIEINADAPLDVPRALHLACHEGYPGHHVQHVWIDDHVVRGRGWQEANLSPGFGWHVLMAEGAADAGADLAFPAPARAAVYRDRLFPAAGLPGGDEERLVRVDEHARALAPVIVDVASAYLDARVTQADAIARLRDEALVTNPEGLLAFAERRRSLVFAYAEGGAYVRSLLARDDLRGLYEMVERTGLSHPN